MSPWLSILIILISCLTLVKGVAYFIESVNHIAHKYNISTYTISFFLVALGTSLPELVVALNSSTSGKVALSFGDVMGSNIALLTIVIALPVFLTHRLSTKSLLHSKDLYFGTFLGFLPLVLLSNGNLSRIDGLILLSSYVFYLLVVFRKAQGIEVIRDSFDHTSTTRSALKFLASLFLMLASSELIVQAALNLSSALLVDLAFVGFTLTAIGTSLPEIAFSIGAINKKMHHQIMGDVVGSVIANSTLVLGTAVVISPIHVFSIAYWYVPVSFTALSLLVFSKFALSKHSISNQEAIALFLLYFGFLITELVFSFAK